MSRTWNLSAQGCRTAVVTTSALLVTACVLSVEPVIPESEAVFEPALIGTWALAGEKDTAVISRAGETGYLIDYVDGQGKRGVFEGQVGWLGDHLVLEVSPVLPDAGASEAYEALIIPTHLQLTVILSGAEVHTAPLAADSLQAMLRRGAMWTPHLTEVAHAAGGDDHLLLTGTTTELRNWLPRYLEHSGALGDIAVWRRVRPGR